MKKTIFLTAMLLTGNLSYTQGVTAVLTETSNFITSTQEIVRNWNDSLVLTYGYTGLVPYLFLSDLSSAPSDPYNSSTTGINKRLIDGYQIRDIYIHQDTAYYCGAFYHTPDSSSGFYGWVCLNNFSLSVPHYYTIPGTVAINKLVAYHDMLNRTKVVAIGKQSPQPTSPYVFPDIFIDVTNASAGAPQIRHFPFSQDSANVNWREEAFDIMLSQNKVVVVGSRRQLDTNQSVCLRLGDMNTTATLGLPNVLYFQYPAGEVNGRIISTTLANDSLIAISYVHYNSNNGRFSTRVHIIDVGFLNGIMLRSKEYPINEKYDPIDMVYVPEDHYLAIVHANNHPDTLMNYVHVMDPFVPTGEGFHMYRVPLNNSSLDKFQNSFFCHSV